ncbi:hypothetical protein MNBD_GAMMA24-396 [hydrothermal vent metagenome]|uniref:STAS domain-containing protein n=1 Tax=hydrothermal vent metagenome TaxID=652676 RepID=A0A3B1BTA8_9ZZZZ
MTKKPTDTSKTNKTTRLGHDPFSETDLSINNNDISQAVDIESDQQCAESKSDRGILSLPSKFSIASVEEVYKNMSSLLTQKQNLIEINAEKIESVDTAAIQMLYAFTAQANILGINTRWKPRSKIINDAAKILNINISIDSD